MRQGLRTNRRNGRLCCGLQTLRRELPSDCGLSCHVESPWRSGWQKERSKLEDSYRVRTTEGDGFLRTCRRTAETMGAGPVKAVPLALDRAGSSSPTSTPSNPTRPSRRRPWRSWTGSICRRKRPITMEVQSRSSLAWRDANHPYCEGPLRTLAYQRTPWHRHHVHRRRPWYRARCYQAATSRL